jgi:hypothetical protein
MDTNHGAPAPPIVLRAVVRGSRFTHYVIDGEHLTLCARVAEYRHQYMPIRDYCGRCVREASARGIVVRP